jgi:hypothetical protein
MKIAGFILLAVGALIALGAFFYDPYVRYSETDLLSQRIEAQSKAIDDRVTRGLATPDPREEDFPSEVYSPERAQNRELGFMAGGALFLLGGVFVAGSGRRRTDLAEASAAG